MATIRARKHRHLAFEASEHDLGGVAFNAGLVDPFPRLKLALDVDLRTPFQEAFSDLRDLAVEHDDAMPLGALLTLAGRLVIPTLARGKVEGNNLVTGSTAADFRILTEIADQDHLVDGSHVIFSHFTTKRRRLAYAVGALRVRPLGTGRKRPTTERACVGPEPHGTQ